MIEKREVTIRRLLTLAGLVAVVSVGACDGSMTGLEEESVAALEAEGKSVVALEAEGKIDGEGAEALPEQEVLPEQTGSIICCRCSRGPVGPPPLIFVDGDLIDGGDHLNNIPPDDIERVEILKGEAAEKLYGHLYGEEGAGGVILIYTKSAAGQQSWMRISERLEWIRLSLDG